MTNRIPTNKYHLASFKERYYCHINDLRDVTEYEYTPVLGNDRYDVIFVSASTVCVSEIKIRNLNSTSYDTAVIELGKFNYLIDKAKANNAKPLYQCYYNDGKVLIWNLENYTDKVSTNFACNTSTVYDQGKKEKELIMLPVTEADAQLYYIPSAEEVMNKFNKKYRLVE